MLGWLWSVTVVAKGAARCDVCGKEAAGGDGWGVGAVRVIVC